MIGFKKSAKRCLCFSLLFTVAVCGTYLIKTHAAVTGDSLEKATKTTQDNDISAAETNIEEKKASSIYAVSNAGSLEDNRTYERVNATPDEQTAMETLDFRGKTYYLVFNEAQLRSIGTGEHGMDKNYMQQADIQLSTDEWVPIGTKDDPFTGSYNGNGCEIKGLTMTNPDAAIIGMFGVAENAHIYNITLRDYDIMSAGKNMKEKSVAPILVLGLGETRSYDNNVYPKK